MPRVARRCPGGLVYHVLNRGNDRKPIFHKRGDARAFIKLLVEAKRRVPIRLLGWCLMSNHWHLVLWPREDGEVSEFIGWLSNAHVRRHRQYYQNSGDGHLYQGRFKSFMVGPDDLHLLMVLRYVEGNALRAGLVERAEQWPWSSLHHWLHGDGLGLLDPWPIERPGDWLRIVNEPLRETELSRIHISRARGSPLGDTQWTWQMARIHGLNSTLRAPGRPPKQNGDIQNIPADP